MTSAPVDQPPARLIPQCGQTTSSWLIGFSQLGHTRGGRSPTGVWSCRPLRVTVPPSSASQPLISGGDIDLLVQTIGGLMVDVRHRHRWCRSDAMSEAPFVIWASCDWRRS